MFMKRYIHKNPKKTIFIGLSLGVIIYSAIILPTSIGFLSYKAWVRTDQYLTYRIQDSEEGEYYVRFTIKNSQPEGNNIQILGDKQDSNSLSELDIAPRLKNHIIAIINDSADVFSPIIQKGPIHPHFENWDTYIEERFGHDYWGGSGHYGASGEYEMTFGFGSAHLTVYAKYSESNILLEGRLEQDDDIGNYSHFLELMEDDSRFYINDPELKNYEGYLYWIILYGLFFGGVSFFKLISVKEIFSKEGI